MVRTFEAERLKNRGYSFATDAETELFSEAITAEFIKRLTVASAHLTDNGVIPFFDTDIDDDALLDWIEENIEEFKEIYYRCEAELWDEIRKYRDKIPGLLLVPLPEILTMPIEEMDLSVRSFNCLKRIGINTVADILDHGDLTDVRNLGKKGSIEVRTKLHELGV